MAKEEALMAVLAGQHADLRPIVVIALQTAMRQGAVVYLRRSQVDSLRDSIDVTNTKSGTARGSCHKIVTSVVNDRLVVNA